MKNIQLQLIIIFLLLQITQIFTKGLKASTAIKAKIKTTEKTCNKTSDDEENCYEYENEDANTNSTIKTLQTSQSSVNIITSALDDENSFNYVRNIKCTYQSCPSPNYCIDETICKCGEKRANVKSDNDTIYCQYYTKLQIIAIGLELLLPGAGHIYIMRYISGFIKLLISIMTIYFFIYTDKRKKGQLFLFVASLVSCSFLIYYIGDIYILLINEYKDGNNIPLTPFF